jgi:hypothetical protein
MMGKLKWLVGFGAGYVLGARAGRQRYEQIAEKAQEWWSDPRVQERAGQAQQIAREKVEQAQQLAGDKVGEKLGGNGTGTGAGSGSSASTRPASASTKSRSGTRSGSTS